jgi:hypothetical protein
MGAQPYWYYTNYQADLNLALQDLREREFLAGRYRPATEFLFPITESTPALGSQHPSIEDAIEASQESGTCSILDIVRVSNIPFPFSRDNFEAALLLPSQYKIRQVAKGKKWID